MPIEKNSLLTVLCKETKIEVVIRLLIFVTKTAAGASFWGRHRASQGGVWGGGQAPIKGIRYINHTRTREQSAKKHDSLRDTTI